MKILLWLQVQVLHTKNIKMHLTALFNVWKKDFMNTARKKKVFFGKEDFFHGNVLGKDFFHDFANFSISENILKFYFIPERFIPS